VKAITIKQPWAWATMYAGKDIENRSWYTKYRGPLLIHAGASYRADARLPRGVRPPHRTDLHASAILGVVELADVVQASRSRWFLGEYGFVLRNPRLFSRPIPCGGKLGLWTPSATQMRRVRAALRSARRSRGGRTSA
jgi:hypothetical protein